MNHIFMTSFKYAILLRGILCTEYKNEQSLERLNYITKLGVSSHLSLFSDPAGIYLLKVNNRKTRARCEICSKLTIKTPERCRWYRSGVFIVSFEHISHLGLVFLLLALNNCRLERRNIFCHPFCQSSFLFNPLSANLTKWSNTLK